MKKMRHVCAVLVTAFSLSAPSHMTGQTGSPQLKLSDVTVGQNLQAEAIISMDGPAPREGLQVTLTSSDPSRLLLADTAEGAGKESIAVKLTPANDPKIYVHGLAKSGTVTYTATAPGAPKATGTVTLAPSGIVISGPFGVGKAIFHTSPKSALETKVSVYPALLDASSKYVAIQALAGNRTAKVTLTSSNPAVGTVADTELVIAGGSRFAVTRFVPAGAGQTTLAVNAATGFSKAENFNSVVANVLKPVLVLDEDVYIGKDLMASATVGLIEPAPKEGLVVTLTSNDPTKLLLSATEGEPGSKSVKITVAPGQARGNVVLQALGETGKVTYTATSSGFSPVTGTVVLMPSGFMISGPNSIMRSGGNPGFVSSLASKKETIVQVYVVYLDPVTHRGTDLTVQSLRPGINLTIPVAPSDPSLGKVAGPVSLKGGDHVAYTRFTPLKAGAMALSIDTPAPFTKSHATSMKVFVTE